jgi:hypothetical protein
MQLIQLLQLPPAGAAETALNKWPISNCFRVSVVPLLIHLLNESKKVFRSRLNACIPIVIVEQDSTMQGAA